MNHLSRGSVVLLVSTGLSITAHGRDLSFEQRVGAQEAIERVSYAHQIGSIRPFELAIPKGVLERRVATYLEESAALEEIWKTPVTAEMLDRELARMAERTRMPERLRELYGALGNDSFVIRECLVRPILVDRLTRELYGFDQSIHATTRDDAEQLRRGLVRDGAAGFDGDARKAVIDIVRAGSGATPQPVLGGGEVPTLVLDDEAFARWRGGAPARVGEIGAIRSELGAYSIAVVLDERPGSARIATFTVPKQRWEAWWKREEGRFDARLVHTVADDQGPVVPQSSETRRHRLEAAFPDASDDSWNDGSLDGLPHPRSSPAMAWTGSVMVLWGGDNGRILDTGGIYDPATDSWRSMAAEGAPQAMAQAVATWTGELVVVQGVDRAYDPATDRWRDVGRPSDVPVPGFDRLVSPVRVDHDPSLVPSGPEAPIPLPRELGPDDVPPVIIQTFSPVSESATGIVFPVVTPVFSELFFGAQGGDFGYCERGPKAGDACITDADCAGNVCAHALDNTLCLAYNTDCKGMRKNWEEYGFNDVLEATYDSSPAPGRQTWIERNWNFISAEGEFWRPFHFALEVDANSTCVGGTNDGALCTLLDEAGVCSGGGSCSGRAPSGGARWTFTPNNKRGNSSLHLRWPWAAVNAQLGTDPYYASGFSSWTRSADFDPRGTVSGGFFKTFLNHTNDRRGPWQNGLYAIIDFNTTDVNGTVSWVNAGFFDARLSGSTSSRVIGALIGVRSEVNLASTSVLQNLGESYGLFVQFNPSGLNVKEASHSGIFINTPTAPGAGTVIGTQNGLSIADQQLVRSGGGGSAIYVSAQTASDGSEGNIRLDGANWNNGHIQLSQGHLWRDESVGVLRYKDGAAPLFQGDGNAALTGTGSNSHGVVLWGVGSSIDSNFDTGAEVCADSGLTCVDTSEFTPTAIPCGVSHGAAKWLAFCM